MIHRLVPHDMFLTVAGQKCCEAGWKAARFCWAGALVPVGGGRPASGSCESMPRSSCEHSPSLP